MSLGSMNYTPSFRASFLERYDTDGSVWIEAIAHTALAAKTAYKVIMDQYGRVTADLAADNTTYHVGITDESCSPGDKIWLQIGGEVSQVIVPTITIVPDEALMIHDGAIANVMGPFTGLPSEFAVAQTAATGATLVDMILNPERITGTTT